MFTNPGKYCIFFILGHIYFVSAANRQPFEPIELTEECLDKYGVSDNYNDNNKIEIIKHKCAESCDFPSKGITYHGLNQNQFAIMCSSVQNTPINDERQENCLKKFNATLNHSMQLETRDGTKISVEIMQFHCAMICLFPMVNIYHHRLYNKDMFGRFCPAVENLRENDVCLRGHCR